MHWNICKEFGIEVKERWYEHEPKAVTEKDSVTILWDMSNLRSGVFFCFFVSLAREGKPSSRERHKGIIGRGHDLRLGHVHPH